MPVPESERHFHRLPGQRLPLERQIRPVGFVVNSWEGMLEIIHERVLDEEVLTFLKQNRGFYQSFFNARLDIAQHRGSERFNKFISRYNNEGSKSFKPERFTTGKPILDLINASLFPNKTYRRR